VDPDQPEGFDGEGLGDCPSGEDDARAVRHRRHRFPARTRVVKARYDEQEYAALAAAAKRAQLTPSGFLAGAGLAAAGHGPAPSQSVDRELLAELLSLRAAIRRYAVNVNQAVVLMHSTGETPLWLSRAVAGAHRAVVSADAATQRVARRLG
jgi:hypothetical protein